MKILKEFVTIYRKGNRRGALCLLSFRLAHYFAFGWKRFIGIPYLLFYHIIFRGFLGFDIHEKTSIGRNFCVWHCFGIAINPNTIIGCDVSIGHNVTIGSKNGRAPIIGNNVEIAPSSVIIGGIRIGDNVVIGAGSIVTKDIPNNAVVVGNPAKILRYNGN